MSTTAEILLGVWIGAGFAVWYGVLLYAPDRRSAQKKLLLLSPLLGPLALLGSIVVVSAMLILRFLEVDEKL